MAQLYALIGDPVSHSISPLIYTALFKKYGISASYTLIRIPRGRLDTLRDVISEYGLSGFNVTMPHKRAILDYIDELDGSARLAGAVNTVVVTDGRLKGYSTDAEGLERSYLDYGVRLPGQSVVMLGAGGAASSIALHMASRGVKSLTILNRTPKSAEALAALITEKTGFAAKVDMLDTATLEKWASAATLLVNTTPIGMHGCGEEFESLDFVNKLPPEAVVSDLIYFPRETALLKAARERGHIAINGLGMLIHQGLIAFRHYCGIETGDSDRALVEQAILSQS